MTGVGGVRIAWARGASAPAIDVTLPSPEALLVGIPAAEAVRRLPSFYGICGLAQTAAGVAALASAIGHDTPAPLMRARALLVAMESLRENALRIALDWPALLDEPVDAAPFRPVVALVPALRAALFGTTDPFALTGTTIGPDRRRALEIVAQATRLLEALVFAEPLEIWRHRTRQDLQTWAGAAPTLAARFVARIITRDWTDRGATQWSGWTGTLDDLDESGPEGIEATLLSRHASDPLLRALCADDGAAGLLPRVVARLVELASLPERMRRLLESAEDAVGPAILPAGVAVVASARGLLAHAAVVADGIVTHYRIVPPTRVNFGPVGTARLALERGTSAEAPASRQKDLVARLLINAYDPCVPYSLQVH